MSTVRSVACVGLVAVAVAHAAVLAAPAAGESVAGGTLVIVGGALDRDNEAVYRAVLDARLEERPICIIPLASGNPTKSARSYLEDFERYGGAGAAVAVNLTTASAENALSEDFAADLLLCGGVFFTGGDQSRIVDVLRPDGQSTLASRAIEQLLAQGAVVAGSSAGAAAMSDPMIGSGNPYRALRRGVTDVDDAKGVWVRDGMGYLERGITGQHFLARSRFPRLLRALLAHPEERFGFGIDEDTAFVVRGSSASVIGRSSVVVLEIRGDGDGEDGPRRLKMHILGEGDSIELSSGEVSPGADKSPLPPGSRPSDRRLRWEDDAFLQRVLALARSSKEKNTLDRKSALVVRKEPGFRALAVKGTGERRTPRGLFAGPFLVEVEDLDDR